MTPRQSAAIAGFVSSVQELKEAKVVRSDRYLGDLAEFLCADAFNIDLASNLREVGHDGMRGEVRVQVKYGGGKKTNVDCGDPDTYQEVYIVLGEGSVIRSSEHRGDFLVYKFTSDEVREMRTRNGRYSCGAATLSRTPDLVISLADLSSS